MRKLLLFLVFFISMKASTQPGDTMKKNQPELNLIRDDSALMKLQKFSDSALTTLPPLDSNEIRENFDRNISGLLEMQKNRRAKEKRAAMIRIGIGIAFLIVLIIGLRRKKINK
ncbi:MAG TPA: hypothetical protein VK483_00340 [Chitinophagaceae bacterium]|nr:hypothetical protein [Chitinophagaceae bacterium]